MQRFIKKVNISEDGEIIGEKVIELYSPFKDGRGYNFKYKSVNIKSYLDIELPDCFSDAEIGRIYRLSKHIYSGSNLLAKRRNNEIVPMSKQDIQLLVKLHRTKYNPFLKKLIEYKVIKQVPIGGYTFYCFNPLYFNSTTYLPLYLYIAFQEELNTLLPDWVVNKYLNMQEQENEGKVNNGSDGDVP